MHFLEEEIDPLHFFQLAEPLAASPSAQRFIRSQREFTVRPKKIPRRKRVNMEKEQQQRNQEYFWRFTD
jgi:hypothetical protein